MRAIAARYILGSDFRLGLKGPAPASLSSLPAPTSKDQESAVQLIATRLREPARAATYEQIADQVQAELSLSETSVPADVLGATDTFRFEERAVVARCFALVAGDKWTEAAGVFDARGQSFWGGPRS